MPVRAVNTGAALVLWLRQPGDGDRLGVAAQVQQCDQAASLGRYQDDAGAGAGAAMARPPATTATTGRHHLGVQAVGEGFEIGVAATLAARHGAALAAAGHGAETKAAAGLGRDHQEA